MNEQLESIDDNYDDVVTALKNLLNTVKKDFVSPDDDDLTIQLSEYTSTIEELNSKCLCLNETQLKGALGVANATATAIVNGLDDLKSDSYMKRSAAILKILGTASGLAVVAGPPGVAAALIISPFCILTAGILERIDNDHGFTETPEMMISRVIVEANKMQTFREQMAKYDGKLKGMSNRLLDLEYYYKNKDYMKVRHYILLSHLDYIGDGEEFLETVMHYIQKIVKARDVTDAVAEAVRGATLIHAYVTIAFIRRKQLTKLLIIFKDDKLLIHSVCRRLQTRYIDDEKRFDWLRHDLTSSNRLLYGQVMALPLKQRYLVETYVGGIPGELCNLCNRVSPSNQKYRKLEFYLAMKSLEMKPEKKDDVVLYSMSFSKGSSLPSRNFIVNFKESGYVLDRTCSIFSVEQGGYLIPGTKLNKRTNAYHIIAGDEKHLWEVSTSDGNHLSTLFSETLDTINNRYLGMTKQDNPWLNSRGYIVDEEYFDTPCLLALCPLNDTKSLENSKRGMSPVLLDMAEVYKFAS